MDTETYKVKVEGHGLTLERDVPKEVGDQIVLLALYGRLPSGTGGEMERVFGASVGVAGRNPSEAAAYTASNNGEPSLGEFLSEKGPKTNTEKIAAIAFYLEEIRGQQEFTRDELAKLFQQARERVPANLRRDLDATVACTWIAASTNDPSRFYLTGTGKQAVQNGFSSDTKKRTQRPVRRRAGSRKPRQTRQGASNIPEMGPPES